MFFLAAQQTEADKDDSGNISYDEFLPVGVDLIMALYARQDAEMSKEALENEARKKALDFLYHGMTKEQVRALSRPWRGQASRLRAAQA